MIKCKDDELSAKNEGFLGTMALCLSLLTFIIFLWVFQAF